MRQFGKAALIWVFIFFVLISLFGQVGSGLKGKEIAYSEFKNRVIQGDVEQAVINGNIIDGYNISFADNQNERYQTYTIGDANVLKFLEENNIRVSVERPQKGNFLSELFLTTFPILLLLGVWIYFMKQMQGGKGGGAMTFGKSRAKLMTEHNQKVTFDDVAGIDEAQEELAEIVDFLRDPGKFHRLGGKIPRGVLLTGSPGTGKTLLARAIAGEANVPFFSISGSDFVEMFVGVGASRVRDMFEQGRKNAPCIIFIDEIDAVGRQRGAGMGGGNDEREQTLNQMLVEMDGFDGHEGVIIVAATNRPDVLDPALLRPGRFDRQVVVPLPDVKGRDKILSIHLRKVPQAPDVNPNIIARGTPGFSGADLANLVNEAALLAARNNKKVVTMADLENAKDKVMMGAERRSLVMSDQEKELTAYHEAGHALVGIHLPPCDPIHKATIIPRGRALGMVMRLPEEDKLSVTREKLHADIAMAMGGRVAEEIIFGHDKVTSGASSDIQYATSMAKNMVTRWGMSEKIGPLDRGAGDEQPFLGYSMGKSSGMSQETANIIDSEVKDYVERGYNLATEILEKYIDDLHTLAKALLEYETLSGGDISDVLSGKGIQRPDEVSEAPKQPLRSFIPKSSDNENEKPQEDSSDTPPKDEPKDGSKKKEEDKKASPKKATKKKPAAKPTEGDTQKS